MLAMALAWVSASLCVSEAGDSSIKEEQSAAAQLLGFGFGFSWDGDGVRWCMTHAIDRTHPPIDQASKSHSERRCRSTGWVSAVAAFELP